MDQGEIVRAQAEAYAHEERSPAYVAPLSLFCKKMIRWYLQMPLFVRAGSKGLTGVFFVRVSSKGLSKLAFDSKGVICRELVQFHQKSGQNGAFLVRVSFKGLRDRTAATRVGPAQLWSRMHNP
jgi:hypothetical protein